MRAELNGFCLGHMCSLCAHIRLKGRSRVQKKKSIFSNRNKANFESEIRIVVRNEIL